MLPERVLEELVRDTPLRERLVTEAWPSFSTESRLQIVQSIYEQRNFPQLPDWLVILALADSNPIVRAWLGLHHYFYDKSELVANDQTDLVRLSAISLSGSDLDAVNKIFLEQSQVGRLIAIRKMYDPRLEQFADALVGALEAQVSDDDLAECATEFFSRSDVRRRLAPSSLENLHPSRDASHGRGMLVLWNLTKTCGRNLQSVLTKVLPTSQGAEYVPSEFLLTLPKQVLEDIVYRHDPGPEIRGLLQLISESPEKFDRSLVSNARIALKSPEFLYWTRDKIKELDQRRSAFVQENTLDVSLELLSEVRALRILLETENRASDVASSLNKPES